MRSAERSSLYGTPGEERRRKRKCEGSFVREGYFKDVDAALSAHPGVGHRLTEKTLGCVPIDIEFWGKACHAACGADGNQCFRRADPDL